MNDIRNRLGQLPFERRARFLNLLRSAADGSDERRPGRRPAGAPAPLSHGQDLLWFLDRAMPGSAAYNVALSLRLDGPLAAPALEAALGEVVARHEALRTSLPELASGPVQLVAEPGPVALAPLVVDGADPQERRERSTELAAALAARPFDLDAGPLWRAALYAVEPQEHLLVLVVHHIVFDRASAQVLVRDLAECYRARTAGTAADLPELPLQFADYAHWERHRLTGDRLERHVDYWRDRLAGAPWMDVPADRPRPLGPSQRGGQALRPLPAETVEAARRFAGERGLTGYPVYLAALLTVLSRYTEQDDLVVGCSVDIRNQAELEHVVGFFLNMLPLRVDVGGRPTFAELVDRVDTALKEGLAHSELPFEQIVHAAAPVRDPSRVPLTQVIFQRLDEPTLPSFAGLSVTHEPMLAPTAKSDLTFQVYEAGADSKVGVEYSADLYDPSTVDTMLAHFAQALAGLLAEPGRAAADVELAGEAERAELVQRWNGRTRLSRAGTVHRWFAERAAEHPDRVAVVAGRRRLTYGEVDRAANRLAWRLRATGVGTEQRVALLLPRGVHYPVAALAVLKAGGAFVPVDPADPAERIARLLAGAAPSAVVTTAADAATLPPSDAAVIVLDDAAGYGEQSGAPAVPAPPEVAGAHNLAYMIYTSGSTGAPKGVLVEHRSLVNFVESVRDLFGLGADDRILGYANHVYDVSLFEMFGALLTGAQLHIALEDDRLDIDRLQRLLAESAITVVDLPPSVMALLDPAPLARLRVAFVGGEAFPAALVNRWNTVARFVNGYGPTECTVTMIAQDCPGTWQGSPPIGRPMDNHVAYVLDGDGHPVPYGVAGELVIGGTGLARGYLGQPMLTRERFIPDPFGATPDGRLYRTGDLVRRRRSGELVFLGRVDRQIKIRGIRIEPGEIESLLTAHPAVQQGYVEAVTDERGQRQLVAYAAVPPALAPDAPDPLELRAYLAERLPGAVVPGQVVVLPELPLTASGKIDRAALPAPEAAPAPVGDPLHQPTPTERVLADELLAELFDRTDIPVNASFFDLGGTSLQAAQLLSAIRRRFEVEVSVADFFLDPTVTGLAAAVERQLAAGPAEDDDLLDLFGNVTDELAAQLAD